MPPSAKFTKEEIISAALSIVRMEGIDKLTARALGVKLNSSSRPIFTVFQSMDEVQNAVISAAQDVYNEYIQQGLSQKIKFKGVGEQYIVFAIREPKLFQLLFMQEQKNVPGIAGVLPLIDSNFEDILLSVQEGYGLDRPTAYNLYKHLWIYTHGIATLCATGMCRFTGEEIGKMISEVFISLLKQVKGDKP